MPKRGSCGSVLPGYRLSKQHPSINSSAVRCCTSRAHRDAYCTLVGFPGTQTLHVAPCSRRGAGIKPHSARCLAVTQLPATSCLGAFSDAGQLSARFFRYCRHPKTSTSTKKSHLDSRKQKAPRKQLLDGGLTYRASADHAVASSSLTSLVHHHWD